MGGVRAARAVPVVLVLVTLAGPVRGSGSVPPDRGSIAGRVTDGLSGAPAPAVPVLLASLPALPRSGRSVLTDPDGRYRFTGLAPGAYLVMFGAAAAPGEERRVTVQAGEEALLDGRLQAGALRERVTVSAAGDGFDGAGASRLRLSRRDIRRMPGSFGDPFRALAGGAVASVPNDLRSDLQVRGGEAGETTVLLDGLPLLYPYHFAGAPGSVGAGGADLISEAALHAGGFSVEHGDALSGIVELVTRDARPSRFGGRAGLSTLAGEAFLEGTTGEGSWWLAGRLSDPGLYDSGVAPGVESLDLRDLHAAWTLPVGPAGRLELGILEASNRYLEEFVGGEAAMEASSRGIRARVDLPLDPRTLLRVRAARSTLDAAHSITGGPACDQEQRRRDLRVSLLRLLPAGHRLSAGAGMDRTGASIAGPVSDGYLLVDTALRDTTQTYGWFIEDAFQSGRWAGRAGVRGDRSTGAEGTWLSPRGGLDFELREGLTLRAAAGRFVQFPRPEQAFLAAGEPLAPQVSDHYVAGIATRPARGPRLVLEAYVKKLRAPIGEPVNLQADLPEAVTQFDTGRVRGVDLTLLGGTAAWRWCLGWGWLRATQRRDGLTWFRNTDRRHSAVLQIDRPLPRGWEAGGTLRMAGGLPYTPEIPWTNGVISGRQIGGLNAARLPASVRLDLRFARRVATRRGAFEGFLEILNATDRRNVRQAGLVFDADTATFRETATTQTPFTPVLGLAVDF
jgi:hypothetical protein